MSTLLKGKDKEWHEYLVDKEWKCELMRVPQGAHNLVQ